MLVSGVGALTTKGLEIIDFCKLNDVSLDFKYFYATGNLSLGLADLTDPTDTPYNDITEDEFIYNLENVWSTGYYQGTVSTSESIISNGQSVLPILMSIVSNDIEEDLDIYTVFISAKDQNGAKLTVADGSSFLTTPQTITIGAPLNYTATLDYIDGDDLYISNIQDSLATNITYDAFIAAVGTSTYGVVGVTDGSSSLAGSTNIGENVYVVYKGTLRYDERLNITLDDTSAFSATSTISNAAGAVGIVAAVNGNILTVDRSNIFTFSNGETVDDSDPFVAATATITAKPSVDTTNSSIVPVRYTSDGSSILLRINLRTTSGFPQSMNFLNTSVTEIEIHNSDESDSHLDIRLEMLRTYSYYAQYIQNNYDQIQSLKNQLNAIITANGLSGGPIV